ncbi:hypothetical protein [Hymenobacter yonginensis]|uniref:Outer membrane protein beta-barrel domain-containing protein n=1 Tax=Hymenobacter yonginensis TaxID=748197 RepID=A0ABY7PN31_9BACT|nr:hypothetical protein [Hymenobacter yonginensis]WBO84665.1 hypothetical protein O9Z63_00135 [Hymenobacter yonginensis]
MKHLFLLAGACLASALGFAQSATNYKPGYLVTMQGDTLRGEIELTRFPSENGVLLRAAGTTTPGKAYLPLTTRLVQLDNGQRLVRRKLVLQRRTQVVTHIVGDSRDSIGVFVQQLTTGAARLYRLDYNLVPSTGTAFEHTKRETQFFLMETAPSGLLVLEQINFRPMLQSVFAGCAPALEQLPRTKFEEDALVKLALAYSSCAPGLPATDLRPAPEPAPKSQLLLGVRAGAARHTLSIGNEPRLARSKAEPLTDWQAAVYARLVRPGRAVSFGAGLQYGKRRTRYASDYVVPVGFTNAGQQFALAAEFEVQALQLPVWVQWGAKSGYGFYVGAGAVPGLHRQGHLVSDALRSVVDPGSFSPRAVAERVTDERFDNGSVLTLGGQLTAGFRPRLGAGKLTPVLEVQYERGKELRDDQFLNGAAYDGLSVRVGVEF